MMQMCPTLSVMSPLLSSPSLLLALCELFSKLYVCSVPLARLGDFEYIFVGWMRLYVPCINRVFICVQVAAAINRYRGGKMGSR